MLQRQLGSKQTHHSSSFHSHAASAGVWPSADESQVRSTLWAKWLGKDFTTFNVCSNKLKV